MATSYISDLLAPDTHLNRRRSELIRKKSEDCFKASPDQVKSQTLAHPNVPSQEVRDDPCKVLRAEGWEVEVHRQWLRADCSDLELRPRGKGRCGQL